MKGGNDCTYLIFLNIFGRKKSVFFWFLEGEDEEENSGVGRRNTLQKLGKEILLKIISQALPNYAMTVFLLASE